MVQSHPQFHQPPNVVSELLITDIQFIRTYTSSVHTLPYPSTRTGTRIQQWNLWYSGFPIFQTIQTANPKAYEQAARLERFFFVFRFFFLVETFQDRRVTNLAPIALADFRIPDEKYATTVQLPQGGLYVNFAPKEFCGPIIQSPVGSSRTSSGNQLGFMPGVFCFFCCPSFNEFFAGRIPLIHHLLISVTSTTEAIFNLKAVW